MTVEFCADEHVPSVFVTTLRSNGYPVVRADEILGESTEDERLLEHCATEEYVLLTHDKKDFGGEVGAAVSHAGVVVYTN